MRLVVQRVSEAKVWVENQLKGSIARGLLVLLGIHREDRLEETGWFVNKLVNLRIFGDEEGKMNRSIKEVQGEILVVSQFTLYGNCLGGRRPDFLQAASAEKALPIYYKFIGEVAQEMGSVQTGEFGAMMQVALINEGPVTLIIEAEKKNSIS